MGWPEIIEAPNVEPGRARYLCIAGYGGNAGTGTWLQFFANNPSNASPLVFSEASTIRALSASTSNITTITLGVYVNAVLKETLVLTNAKTGVKTDLLIPVFEADELSIKVESGSGKDVNFFTHVRVDL